MGGSMVRFDQNRMGAGVSFPGIDPRNWFVLAVVKAIKVDARGAKADVAVFPDEHEETVAIGGMVGKGHGLYVPIAVDQLVIVAYPHGSSDAGGVIVGSQWDRGQPAPARVLADTAATALVGADGKPLRVIAQGDDAALVLESTAGLVLVGLETAELPAARQTDAVEVTIPPLTVIIANPLYPADPVHEPEFIPNPLPITLTGTITGGSAKVRIS